MEDLTTPTETVQNDGAATASDIASAIRASNDVPQDFEPQRPVVAPETPVVTDVVNTTVVADPAVVVADAPVVTDTVPPVVPPVVVPADLAALSGGKITTTEQLNAALAAQTELEATKAQLPTPEQKAYLNLLADPVKLEQYFALQRTDFKTMPADDVLKEKFFHANPTMPRNIAEIMFENQYAKEYPNLEFDDPEAPEYKRDLALRDYQAEEARKEMLALQETQKAAVLAAVPTTPVVQPAAEAPVFSDEELANHVASVKQVMAGTVELSLVVAGQQLAVPVSDAARVEAEELVTDIVDFYQKRVTSTDAAGQVTTDYAKLRDMALRTVNFDGAVAAAYARGVAAGKPAGAAEFINPGDNVQPPPSSAADPITYAEIGKAMREQRQQRTAAEVDY